MTETLKPKKVVAFKRFSVCDFLFVSTRRVLFFSFLTDFGEPIILSICFSIMKGERDVTAFSSIDLITRNLANVSLPLKTKLGVCSKSSSDSV